MPSPFPKDEAGYYLIVDTTDFSKDDSYHAYNSFLLKVNKGNWNVQITPKAEKPTVEKKVYDNRMAPAQEVLVPALTMQSTKSSSSS